MNIVVKIIYRIALHICTKKMHKGQILEKAIRQSGVPIANIARRMSKSRVWLYNLFQNEQVSIDIILKIGEIIHHDFKNEILSEKEAKRVRAILEEPEEDKNTSQKLNKEDYWKDKYLQLLEKHNDLLTTIQKQTKSKK
jgi:hypothetical protein